MPEQHLSKKQIHDNFNEAAAKVDKFWENLFSEKRTTNSLNKDELDNLYSLTESLRIAFTEYEKANYSE